MNSITNNKEFWRTIKPFLSGKVTAQTKISLVEKDKLLSNETKVAETLSNFFENAITKLGINRDDAEFNDEPMPSTNPVDIAIQKFDNQPSVKLIRDITLSDMFQLESASLDDILKEIANLNSAKNSTFKNIQTRCLKEVSGIYSAILTQIWSNEIINKESFPTNLKLKTPVFKNIDSTLAENYRPVSSVLPTVSKVFEKLMQKQLNNCINKFLSPFLCGYRKG